MLIDYACMNYILTHPAQSERVKKDLLVAKVPEHVFVLPVSSLILITGTLVTS